MLFGSGHFHTGAMIGTTVYALKDDLLLDYMVQQLRNTQCSRLIGEGTLLRDITGSSCCIDTRSRQIVYTA